MDKFIPWYCERSLFARSIYHKKAFLIEKNPDIDAVIFTDDQIAYNAINKTLQMGFNVPDDISFIGFDNSEICDTCSVKITSVSFDRYKIGVNAANLLFQKLDGSDKNQLGITTTEPELIFRESVAKKV